MTRKLLPVGLVAMALAAGWTPAAAESRCDAVRAEQGVLAYTRCVAREAKDAAAAYGRNYVPGAGGAPGMLMDEMRKKVDEGTDLCHGEGSPCDGVASGVTVKQCKC